MKSALFSKKSEPESEDMNLDVLTALVQFLMGGFCFLFQQNFLLKSCKFLCPNYQQIS
jgi:hypothetical protein